MKKKMIGFTCLAVLSSMVVGNTVAFANPTTGTPDTRDVKARVGFIEDNGGQKPVDPTNPDPEKPVGPVDPTDPTTPVPEGTSGPLSLDYASILDFGTQNKISLKDEIYYALPQKIKNAQGAESLVPNYAQVTDKRGNLDGWLLTVKQNGQFKAKNDANQDKELVGAKITFLNGEVVSLTGGVVPSGVKTKVELFPTKFGTEINVVNAKVGEGFGTWVYRSGNDTTKAESVQLEVPGSSAKLANKEYTTTLTWTLKNAPITDAEFNTPDTE